MKKILIPMLLLGLNLFAFAQDANVSMAGGFRNDNEFIYSVKVWGEVAKPNVYEVPIEYDMLGILSIAGGPLNSAKLSSVKVIRAQRLNDEEPIVVYVDLERYIETGDESLIPEIREGDIIMVPPKFGKDFIRNFASILAIAQSITIMAYYVDNIMDK